MSKEQRSKREREYVEHVQNLRRKSNTERNRKVYSRNVKHKDRQYV